MWAGLRPLSWQGDPELAEGLPALPQRPRKGIQVDVCGGGLLGALRALKNELLEIKTSFTDPAPVGTEPEHLWIKNFFNGSGFDCESAQKSKKDYVQYIHKID